MIPSTIVKTARDFDMSPEAGFKMRIRFLCDQAGRWDDYFTGGDIPTGPDAIECLLEIGKIKRYALQMKRGTLCNTITDDMIEAARNYPIESLIEFRGGKVKCPFHEDKNPSAYYGNRSKKLVCPVCNKTWNALDILLERDNIGFIEAVRSLQ